MIHQRAKQIPIPGNSGDMPTGAIQFRNDWPGLFVRGDDCMMLYGELRELGQSTPLPRKLLEVLEIIGRDVIVWPDQTSHSK